jgi:hypothetical protein
MDYMMVLTLGLCASKKLTITKNGFFDDHADAAVQWGAHCPMEHILGFTRSNWILPLGKSPARLPMLSFRQVTSSCQGH